VPTGLIQHHDGVRAGCDLGCDLVEMPLHGLGVAARKHKAGADAACGADGAEDVGRLGALVPWRARPSAASRPAARELVLLPDARFVLPPDLYRGAGADCRADRRQRVREGFLKSSSANSFCA